MWDDILEINGTSVTESGEERTLTLSKIATDRRPKVTPHYWSKCTELIIPPSSHDQPGAYSSLSARERITSRVLLGKKGTERSTIAPNQTIINFWIATPHFDTHLFPPTMIRGLRKGSKKQANKVWLTQLLLHRFFYFGHGHFVFLDHLERHLSHKKAVESRIPHSLVHTRGGTQLQRNFGRCCVC